MGPDGVFPAEMPERGPALPGALDDNTVERLVCGRVEPDDAPPGYAGVARVLQAAGGPAEPDELAGRDAALAVFRAAGPAGERGRAGSRAQREPGPRGVPGRGRPGPRTRPGPAARGWPGGRARARVVALALAGVVAAGGLWMAGGARTVPGLRSPTGRAGSPAPGLVTQARPMTPPVTGAGANARASLQSSARQGSTSRNGGVTASRSSGHGSRQHRPGNPPTSKPKPKPKSPPQAEISKPNGSEKPRHQR